MEGEEKGREWKKKSRPRSFLKVCAYVLGCVAVRWSSINSYTFTFFTFIKGLLHRTCIIAV